ncbi:MAG TPA: zinc ribbon domain-containing protein [Pyrinomonadaceae bacterium]|nr:zinc ribbon domain-containing protein [Pyrinomonadaceae bacterium]
MYCPRCGEERASEATSFCSKCGFLLTGAAELIETGGAPLVPTTDLISPRSRGIRLGLFMLLLTFVVAPIMGMISTFGFGIVPWPMGVVIFLLGGGGLLRIAYAMMFESNRPSLPSNEWWPKPLATRTRDEVAEAKRVTADLSLPPTSFISETFVPSVTDPTTKLLQKDKERTD